MAGAIVFQNFFSDSDPTKFRMYFFRTKAGVFSIVRHNDRWRLILSDRWRLIFGSDTLGSYSTAEQAVDDLATGHFSLRLESTQRLSAFRLTCLNGSSRIAEPIFQIHFRVGV